MCALLHDMAFTMKKIIHVLFSANIDIDIAKDTIIWWKHL